MFCPVCESEYQPGITKCPDDGAELVEALSTEVSAGDDSEASFVTLHTLSSPVEAEMVNDILRQNGVRSAVQGGANDQFSPVFSAVSPGVAILVDERDLDRAKELYASFFGDDTSPLTGPLRTRTKNRRMSEAIVVFMTAAKADEAQRIAERWSKHVWRRAFKSFRKLNQCIAGRARCSAKKKC